MYKRKKKTTNVQATVVEPKATFVGAAVTVDCTKCSGHGHFCGDCGETLTFCACDRSFNSRVTCNHCEGTGSLQKKLS